jgi:hypothetical protein
MTGRQLLSEAPTLLVDRLKESMLAAKQKKQGDVAGETASPCVRALRLGGRYGHRTVYAPAGRPLASAFGGENTELLRKLRRDACTA